MFTDSMGVKIFTREGVVYLTEENCEVMWWLKHLAEIALKELVRNIANWLVKNG
jgi:hypothetical protein